MEVSYQITAPGALLSEKMPGGWLGYKAGLVTVEKRRNLLPLPEIEPTFLIRSSCNVVTIQVSYVGIRGVSQT
jgi:hypothetical protein